MSGVKISALPASTGAQLTDIVPAVQSGVTNKTTLQQIATLFGMSGGILGLAGGGTNADLSGEVSNGGIVWSNATQMQILAGTSTAHQLLMSGSSASPLWSTSTYPTTNAINTLLYASSANVMAALPTANSATLITSAGGVPSLSQTLPSAVQTNITALGAQAQALNMNSHLINNVTDPVSAQDAATKNYVDQTALNGTSVYAASAGSLGTVTQSGSGVGATLTNAGAQATFALDGVNPPVGSNVLIKNTATGMTAANEGIYVVTNAGSVITNWVLTRASSYDTPTEINNTGLIIIDNGSTLAGQAWYNSATIVTVDTTNFSFSRFGTTGTVTSVATSGLATGGPITSTGTITVTAASSSDQVTATSSTVAITPSVQQYHPSSVKFAACYDDSGNIQGTDYNVSSYTNTATGVNRVNFTVGPTVNTNIRTAYMTLANGGTAVKLNSVNTAYAETSCFSDFAQTSAASKIINVIGTWIA